MLKPCPRQIRKNNLKTEEQKSYVRKTWFLINKENSNYKTKKYFLSEIVILKRFIFNFQYLASF